MGLDVARARARAQSLHHSAVDVKKSQRQRSSSSVEATFVSTAVVPAHDSTEILSSLISSLTVLSDSARDQLQQVQSLEADILDASAVTLHDDPFISGDISDSLSLRGSAVVALDDDNVAEAPVIGYARGNKKTSKKSSRDKWAGQRADKTLYLSNHRRESSTILRATGATSSIGIPSIERGTTPSIAATDSRTSIDQSAKSPLKMLFSARPSEEFSRRTPISFKDYDARSVRTTKSRQSARHLKDRMLDSRTPEPQLVLIPDDLLPPEPIAKVNSAGQPHNVLSSAVRNDLTDNLIPSRISSTQNSPKKSNNTLLSPSSNQPSYVQASEAKSVSDYGDTAEDEDPTMRRIRELQRAKEQRQLDRLKESKQERTPRRATPSSKYARARSTSKSTQRSATDSIAEVPEHEQPPLPSIRHDMAAEPPIVPIIQKRPASPVTPTVPPRSPSKQGLVVKNGLHTTPASPQSHKRTFSGGLRRSASYKRTSVVEMKNVAEQVEAFLTAPRLTQRIRHPRTGRTIAFSEVGDPDGFAVFVCVGMGLTRYVTSFYDDIARMQKLRLITPDRPGTGESDSYTDTSHTPLMWADDVTVICQSLNIQRFSLLAHSAGTIYALATALKMPQYVRGKIHLLAPWIPPSQMAARGTPNVKSANLPTAHRILSKLPTGFLKAANSRFLSASTASIDSGSGRKKSKSGAASYEAMLAEVTNDVPGFGMLSSDLPHGRSSVLSYHEAATRLQSPSAAPSPGPGAGPRLSFSGTRSRLGASTPTEGLSPQARLALYNSTLTRRTWVLATANANPANDLIVCLERRRPIGFFYHDVTRGVVIHHGRHDARVPLENAQWLESVMKRCELRILEDESHSLMASAKVMSEVLAEIGHEWEEWEIQAKDKERRKKHREAEKEKALKVERDRFIRTGDYSSFH